MEKKSTNENHLHGEIKNNALTGIDSTNPSYKSNKSKSLTNIFGTLTLTIAVMHLLMDRLYHGTWDEESLLVYMLLSLSAILAMWAENSKK